MSPRHLRQRHRHVPAWSQHRWGKDIGLHQVFDARPGGRLVPAAQVNRRRDRRLDVLLVVALLAQRLGEGGVVVPAEYALDGFGVATLDGVVVAGVFAPLPVFLLFGRELEVGMNRRILHRTRVDLIALTHRQPRLVCLEGRLVGLGGPAWLGVGAFARRRRSRLTGGALALPLGLPVADVFLLRSGRLGGLVLGANGLDLGLGGQPPQLLHLVDGFLRPALVGQLVEPVVQTHVLARLGAVAQEPFVLPVPAFPRGRIHVLVVRVPRLKLIRAVGVVRAVAAELAGAAARTPALLLGAAGHIGLAAALVAPADLRALHLALRRAASRHALSGLVDARLVLVFLPPVLFVIRLGVRS